MYTKKVFIDRIYIDMNVKQETVNITLREIISTVSLIKTAQPIFKISW